MANQLFFTRCFTEWKSGKLSHPLLKCCKELINDELISKLNVFYKIKSIQEFSKAFHSMCQTLFKYGVKTEYALVLIAFTLALDEEMLKFCEWYTSDLLIELLSEIFKELNFDPRIFNLRTKTWKDFYSMIFDWSINPFFCYFLKQL